eukprot:g8400.t1
MSLPATFSFVQLVERDPGATVAVDDSPNRLPPPSPETARLLDFLDSWAEAEDAARAAGREEEARLLEARRTAAAEAEDHQRKRLQVTPVPDAKRRRLQEVEASWLERSGSSRDSEYISELIDAAREEVSRLPARNLGWDLSPEELRRNRMGLPLLDPEPAKTSGETETQSTNLSDGTPE